MGFAHASWLREAAGTILAAVALVFWHGQVHAACDSDAIASVFLEESAPLPTQSAPSRAGPILTAAAERPRAGEAPAAPVAALACGAVAADCAGSHSHAHADFPWRRYCARSARLLL